MSPQHPLPSGFGAKTTPREVIGERRLDGTTAIVTGGYAGIGLETTRVLAAAGAHVIVPARDIAKATAALSGLANVTIDALDLGVSATIDAFAARFGERPLHLLINNAGIMAAPLSRDARGLESQLAVNHVGHFRLFTRLLPALRRANGARVVALSSRGHVRSAFDFEDPNFEHRPYDKMVAYGQSKTANVLFAVEAERRYQPDGIRAFSLHPGAILETDLARNYDPEELKLVVERARRIGSFKTVEQGAATTIWCATSSRASAASTARTATSRRSRPRATTVSGPTRSIRRSHNSCGRGASAGSRDQPAIVASSNPSAGNVRHALRRFIWRLKSCRSFHVYPLASFCWRALIGLYEFGVSKRGERLLWPCVARLEQHRRHTRRIGATPYAKRGVKDAARIVRSTAS